MGYFRKNIEQISGYQPGLQPAGVDIIKLNTNENPYPPSPKVMRALNEIRPEQLRRYPDPLGDVFRRVAAEVNAVEPEYIMCCNGGDELLSLAVRVFCDEKRPLAYPVPTYSLYPVLAGLQNCKAIEVPFDDEFNLPARLANTGANLTILCNPNAPSGTFISVSEIASLADELKETVLLIDEAYADFAEDNCVNLVRDFDNVIILRSMSKGYSLAGLRFGYAVAKPDMINGLVKAKDSYNVDAISIAAAAAALKDRKYFTENIRKIKESRQNLIEQLRGMDFAVPDSFANFVIAESKSCQAADIYERLVQRCIYVRYFKLPGLENKLRITVGTDEQNRQLMLALKEILQDIK